MTMPQSPAPPDRGSLGLAEVLVEKKGGFILSMTQGFSEEEGSEAFILLGPEPKTACSCWRAQVLASTNHDPQLDYKLVSGSAIVLQALA